VLEALQQEIPLLVRQFQVMLCAMFCVQRDIFGPEVLTILMAIWCFKHHGIGSPVKKDNEGIRDEETGVNKNP
jgi:hypothetical protein